MDVYETFTAPTFPAALAALAHHHGDLEAVVAPEDRLTFGELAARADAFAGALAAAGLRPGDRLGIQLPNGLRWIVTSLGAHRAGLTVVPINTWYRSTELKHVAQTVGLRLVVTAGTIFGRDVLEDLREAGYGERFGDAGDRADGYLGAVVWPPEDPLPAALPAGPAPDTEATAADLAFILFTSGSTALPKPVPVRQGRLLDNSREVARRMRLRPGDRLWIASPFFFGFGCENAFPVALSHAVTLCLQERVDPEAALAMIERERATVYYGLTPTTRMLTASEAFDRYDISSLRTGVLGLMGEDNRVAHDRLGLTDGVAAYGITEGYGFVATTDADDPLEVRLRTQGRALPTQELRVVDEQGVACPPDVIGQLEIRGAVTEGYLDSPEQNAEAFTPDGWFRTGDLASVDAEGRMSFVGRWKELMKIRGIRIAPSEVEKIIIGHPDVEEVFVVGMTDRDGDEQMACAVVPRRGADTTDLVDRITHHIRERAASYKVPSRFRLVESGAVPVTDTGKVSRRLLREQFETAERAR
jgi:HIP---CoA ligase